MRVRGVIFTGLVTVCVVAVSLVFMCVPVLASERLVHEYAKTFGAAGSGDDQFNDPVKVAVDEGTGDVYVADEGNGRVEKFDAEGNYVSQFDGSKTPDAGLGEFLPRYLAVDNACVQHEPVLTGTECEAFDPSAGDVYVVDAANNVVDKYGASGNFLGRLPAAGGPVTLGVAVDTAGNVIVTSAEGLYGFGQISAYSDAISNSILSSKVLLPEGGINGIEKISYGLAVSSDELLYFLAFGSFTLRTNINGEGSSNHIEAVGASASGGGSSDLAFELSTGELYADIGSALRAYDQSYNEVEQIGTGLLTGSTGMAVNSTTHTVYAVDTANNNVEIFVEVVLPTLTVEPVSNVVSRSITLNGAVLPKGGLEANTIEFEYGTGNGPDLTVAASPATCVAGGSSCPVSANVTGLLPNTTYHCRLLADNSHDKQQITEEENFTTSAELPAVESESTSVIAQTSATVIANINPEHDETTYHVQYGTDTKYGAIAPVPDATVGSGYTAVKVGEGITGLQPGQTYHYRVVATSLAGPPVDGPDQTFTTLAPTPPVVSATTVNGVSQNSVSVSGSVNPEGVQSSYEFDLGVDTSYGTSTFGNTGFGTEPVNVNATFSGLAPDTTYHYRLLATNIYGTTYGPDQTFTTPSYLTATLSGPVTPILLAVPTVSFPSYTTTASTPKAKKPTKKKKTRQRKKKRGKATRKGKRHTSSGRHK